MLKGIKPEKVEKRLKALFYGTAGVGKTIASIQFPSPYLIDTERGAENDQYIELLSKNNGVIFQTNDIDEIIQEVKTLISQNHSYKTLIIDPLTEVYNRLLDEEALKTMEDGKSSTAFGRHYIAANRKIKHLLNLLLRLDMNVIVTSHAKTMYGDNFQNLGQTFDCYKKLDYLFDLVFEVIKRGDERVAIVKKSRIKSFTEGDNFVFSYKEIANKYGNKILEKESDIQNFAKKEDIVELNRLIDLLKVPDAIITKWLTKSKAETFDEMDQDHLDGCIKLLRDKIKCQTLNKEKQK